MRNKQVAARPPKSSAIDNVDLSNIEFYEMDPIGDPCECSPGKVARPNAQSLHRHIATFCLHL